jgi:hypothetical protein
MQKQGSYPGEDWQVDFTHMPHCQGYKPLLVFIDIFTGWIEAFPTQMERASKVAKALLKELYLGLPVRIAIISNTTTNRCWRGCGEKGTFLHCWWECKLVQPLWKKFGGY